MKKVSLILAGILLLSVGLTGCGAKSTNGAVDTAQSIETTKTESSSVQNNSNNTTSSNQNSIQQNTNNDDIKSTIITNPKDLLSYIGLTKGELINKLGKSYKEESGSDEGGVNPFTVVTFEDKGLQFIFKQGSKTVNNINCSKTVNINGASSGMKFKQIEEKLGKGKIEQTVDTGEGQMNAAIYTLTYNINGNRVSFSSYQRDGANSQLVISKN